MPYGQPVPAMYGDCFCDRRDCPKCRSHAEAARADGRYHPGGRPDPMDLRASRRIELVRLMATRGLTNDEIDELERIKAEIEAETRGQSQADGRSEICRCSCHDPGSGTLHMMACCDFCADCGQLIARPHFEAHRAWHAANDGDD